MAKAITDPVPAKAITRSSGCETIFNQLLSAIVSGAWKEGERISAERDLCRQLGVARPSLREALKALQIMGLLDCRVGEGTFVRQRSEFLAQPLLWAITGSSTTDLNGIVEARLVLEVELAGFAASRGSAADLDAIRRGVQDLEDGIRGSGNLLEADLDFHLAVANAAHNQILLNAVQMIRNLTKQWMLVTLHVPGVAAKALDQHRLIYQAIADNNPAGARDRMRQHLEEMGDLLIRIRRASL